MQTGEYRFNNVECIEINKPLMDGLFASALYCMEDEYILEVLAPETLMYSVNFEEYEEMNYTNGDSWERNSKKELEEKWPLLNANYYVQLNGKEIGKNLGTCSCYRSEPQNIITTKAEEKITTSEVNVSNSNTESANVKILTSEENDIIKTSPQEAVKDILSSKQFKEVFSSTLESLPCLDPDAPDYEDKHIKYEQERKRKEAEFFRKFRNSVTIPDYLKNERMIIADLVFRGTNLLPIDKKNPELSFKFENYIKHYVPRINLQLPLGKYGHFIQTQSEEHSRFIDKIFIEDVIVHDKQNDSLSKQTPDGKKAVYIVYETIDNESIRPIFHTKEFLNSYDFTNYMRYMVELLDDKGTHGFNKYITCAGYIDENELVADLELFQLVVTFQYNKEIKLL